jgi:hypothetical protein
VDDFDLPKETGAFPQRKPHRHNISRESRALGNELAAIAYVAMENGDYVYNDPRHHPHKGSPINKSELMRLAGYSKGSIGQWDKTLGRPENKEFWQLVELYRLRRTDPMFRKEEQKNIIGALVAKLTHELYEAIAYYPHTIPFKDKLAALKTIVDLGYRVSTPDADSESRAGKLLESLSPEQRKKAISGLKNKLSDDLADVEALEKAHAAADSS